MEPEELELEKERLREDTRLREVALELERQRLNLGTGANISPLVAGILGALCTAVAAVIVALVSGFFNLGLEDKKLEGALILDAIQTGETRKAATNLLFLSDANLIELLPVQVETLRAHAGEDRLPVLPARSLSTRGGFSCPLHIDANVETASTPAPYSAGDDVRICLSMGLSGRGEIEVHSVQHRLDCMSGGIIELCSDAGSAMVVPNNRFSDLRVTSTCPVKWLADYSDDDPNELVFVPSSEFLIPGGTSCELCFTTEIGQGRAGSGSDFISAASGVDGVCTNGMSAAGRASLAIRVGDR